MIEKPLVGIAAYGLYLPETKMTAADIAAATGGHWTEEAVQQKLGIKEKTIPGPNDGTQAMGVKAALDLIERFEYPVEKIDVILCIGEEWKEYPLTTSGIYIQEKIGAVNAWAMDVQQRCCSMLSAMQLAKALLIADDDVSSVMIVGGYRNGDLVDYANPRMSMMYNLAAGACALVLEKDHPENEVLGGHIVSDGSMAWDAGCRIGGIVQPVTADNAAEAYRSLDLMNPDHMKDRLNEVSLTNWYTCIDRALGKSGLSRSDVDFLAILHFKRSMYKAILGELGLSEEQAPYLSGYGHIGQIDQVLALHIGLESGRIQKGSNILMIAAGIGYAWAATVVRWG